MRSFETTRQVPHAAAEMFDLVADVEAYSQFVPLCEALRVRERTTRGGLPCLVADMTAAYGPFRETFTSRVTLDRPKLQILVEYLDGPFRHLENRWTFRDTGPATSSVHFFIAYEFRSMPLQLLVGTLFDKAFQKFSAAFAARADAVYGRARVRAGS